jgi:inner membrane transporter RhtA
MIAVQISAATAYQIFRQAGAAGAALLGVGFAALILLAWARPRWRELSGRSRLWMVGYGAALAGLNVTFYLGISRVPLGAAVAIEFLGPLTVAAVMARPLHRWWVLLACLGVLALTRPWEAGSVDLVGVAWLLVDAVCWGSYIVLAGRAARELPGLQPVAIAMAVAAVVLFIPGVATARIALVQPHVLEVGLFIAVVGQVIPYSFEQVALRTIPAGVFGVLMSLEPAIAAAVGYLALRQSPGIPGIVGTLAVVTAGVAVTVTQPAEPAARQRPLPGRDRAPDLTGSGGSGQRRVPGGR